MNLSEFLGNEIDFINIMDVLPIILAKNCNFKKLRHGFVGETAMITTTLITSNNWKTLVPFFLLKKRPEPGRHKDVVKTSYFWSQRRLRLV